MDARPSVVRPRLTADRPPEVCANHFDECGPHYASGALTNILRLVSRTGKAAIGSVIPGAASRALIWRALCAAPFAFLPGSAFAQSTVSHDSSGPPKLEARDLAAFFGGLIPYALAQGDIAGLSLAVVDGDSVIFQSGYGYANVATGQKMTPFTPVRIASITKTFTFTAVLQLVERHKLDLDRDINAYLDFKIPYTFHKPITLRNLMTHTAGFEDSSEHLFVHDISAMRNLGEYVRHNLPARIYPPGRVIAYSNYGAALAGYIVERASGLPYAGYLEENIFSPLGMRDSTASQPLPEKMASRLSKGYLLASNAARPMNWVEPAPAGAMTSTAADLARFAIAHLNGGSFRGHAILLPKYVALMHQSAWRAIDNLNGYTLGFEEENRNGLRIIGHGGDLQTFETDMHLLPDRKVGLIVLMNSAGSRGAAQKLRVAIFRAFLDRYFPAPPDEAKKRPGMPAPSIEPQWREPISLAAAPRATFCVSIIYLARCGSGSIRMAC